MYTCESKELSAKDHGCRRVGSLRLVGIYSVRKTQRHQLLVTVDGHGHTRSGTHPVSLVLNANAKPCKSERHDDQARYQRSETHLWDKDTAILLDSPLDPLVRAMEH